MINLIQRIDQPIVGADLVVEYNVNQDVSNLTALVRRKTGEGDRRHDDQDE